MPQHKIYGFPFQTKTSQGTNVTQVETHQKMTTFKFNFPFVFENILWAFKPPE